MTDFIILGTDTDVGKTTFALLWLRLFAEQWEYWKPVETGDSDSARVSQLAPGAVVHPPAQRFHASIAPPLAARLEGARVLTARDIAGALPRALNGERGLVIETFGSPFSPLNDDELQLAFVRKLNQPCVLVSSTTLGCIGRTMQALVALQAEGIAPFAVVLLGKHDAFAEEKIRQHRPGATVVSMQPPDEWTSPALAACAERQRDELLRVHSALMQINACLISPLSPVLGGEGPGVRGRHSRKMHPSPQPLSPEYRGEGLDDESMKRILAEDRRCVWHPYTSLLDEHVPLACVGARDEFLELADGRQVIDGISSWWTILQGHRYPPLMQALAEASRRIDHVLFAGVTHPHAVELADLLLGTMPWCGGRVFYSDNGSTAVEVALKLAYQYWCHHDQPTRTRFVGFEHAYHGDTFGAMAVSRDPVFFGRFEPLLFQADILPLEPDRLDEHLQRHREQIAAVILEPLVQGAGGMRMHSPETLRQIVEIAHRHGVLFIADEVMTGGGRTGTLWAHQAAGVVPDLLCAAKTLTGGILPLAATLVAPAIVEAFRSADRGRTFFHGHSFTANPLACAVAACNFRQLLAHPPDAPQRIEQFWLQALQPLRQHPRVKDVRIRGSIAAVEIDAVGGYLAEIGRAMRRACLARDVLLRPLGSVLYALPPHCTTPTSLQKIADAMSAAVDAI